MVGSKGAGGTHRPARRSNGIRAFSLMAVVITVLSVFCVMMTDRTDVDAEISNYDKTHLWSCYLTIDRYGNVSTNYYVRASTGDSWSEMGNAHVNGSTHNASYYTWSFNSTDGYGPFNSFYAAFALDGTMKAHLNPGDLSKSIDPADTTDYNSGAYNIMWVLPKIYASVQPSGRLLLTNDKTLCSTVYDAFKCGSSTYNYLAIGVYEAYTGATQLKSIPNVTPLTNKELGDFRWYASQNATSSDGVRVSQLWNYYQWQLYRFCSMAAIGTWDSQSAIGNGKTDSDSTLKTGYTYNEGPYYGYTDDNKRSVKLFIEDAWGSVSEFIDDTVVQNSNGVHNLFYAGTHSYSDIAGYWKTVDKYDSEGIKFHPTYTNGNVYRYAFSSNAGYTRYGGVPCTALLCNWGLPSEFDDVKDGEYGPDYIVMKESNGVYALVVGDGPVYLDNYSGLHSMTCVDTDKKSKYYGTRLVFLLDTDSKEVETLTLSKSAGVASITVKAGSSTSTTTTKVGVIKGTYITVNGNTISFANSTGSYSISAKGSDGYVLTGWYKNSESSPTGVDKSTRFVMNSDTTLTMKAQAVTILTVGTDGGGTLHEKIGTSDKASISEGQTYMVAKAKDAISISGNTLTFTGYHGTASSTSVVKLSSVIITADATTVAGGGIDDHRILGWIADGGTNLLGASKNKDGTVKADTIDLTNVKTKSLELSTIPTVVLEIPKITGATLTLNVGGKGTNISAGQVFTLDQDRYGSSSSYSYAYPQITVKDNIVTFTGYIGLPGNDIVTMGSMTVTAVADLKADGKDTDYRLAGWYVHINGTDENRIAGTAAEPKKCQIMGFTGTTTDKVDGKDVTRSNAATLRMDTVETKTFYIADKYGGTLSSKNDLSGTSPYLFIVDADSTVTIGNGSNSYGLGEIAFRGYIGSIKSTEITNPELDEQKITAVADSGYRFWIWSSVHVSDENASSDSSRSYGYGTKLYARFAAQVYDASALQIAASNSVGLIEVLGDVSADSIDVVKDSDGLGGPYMVIKPEVTLTISSSLSTDADTGITIQPEDAVPASLSALADDADNQDVEEKTLSGKLVNKGTMTIGGKVTVNGILSSIGGDGIVIESGAVLINNSQLEFSEGATYVVNAGGNLINNGSLKFIVKMYDPLLDAIDKATGSVTISVIGKDLVVDGVIDIPGNDAVISLMVEKGATMTIAEDGGINVKDSCSITVDGTLTNSGAVSIQGTIDPADEESEKKSGIVTVNGTIDNIGGTFTIDANGTLTVASGGIFHIGKKSTYEKNGGVLENDGAIVFDVDSQSRLLEYMEKADANTRVDIVKADDGKRFDISQAITIPSATNPDVTLEVVFTSGTESAITSGGLTIADNGTVTVAGKLTNRGTITTIGTSENGGFLKVTGELVNTGRLVGDNNGRITVSGYQDNQAGTLTLKNGTSLTIETSGKVHVDLDSEYEKSGRGALNNYGLLIIDVNTEEGLNEAIEKAQEVINLGAGQVRIDIVEDMKIKGKVSVPDKVNVVITEDTTVTVRPTGRLTVLDGGTLTVDGKLIVEYGGRLKIEDGGNLVKGPNGKVIKGEDDEDGDGPTSNVATTDDSATLVVAFAAAAVASLFALTMFMDQYRDTATVTFYPSAGGYVQRRVVRVPNGTEMMIKGRNAIFYIEGKELPQIITAEPEKGHRFDVWNLYDQDDGSWYPSKGHSMYGDEKSFFVVGNVEMDVMFAEGENDGIRAINFESRVRVTKGFRDPNAFTEKHEDRIGADEF